MTPPELAAKNTEHGHQQALFAWAQIAKRYGFYAADDPKCYKEFGYVQSTYGRNPRQEPNPSGKGMRWLDDGGIEQVPELEWLHAIPNGGQRDAVTAALLKAEGVKRGILDVFLPYPMKCAHSDPVRYIFGGLYIEMKRPKSSRGRKGVASAEQTEYVGYARHVGYAVAVCFDWFTASREIVKYVMCCREAG